MTLDEFSKLFGGLGGLAAAIAVVWGVYAYFEDYQVAVRKDRIERTLVFVERFSSGRLASAQEEISARWTESKAYSDFQDKMARGSKMTDDEKRSEYIRLQFEIILEKPSINKAIWAVVDFFDALWICISEKLCDRATADRFFREHATRFVNLNWAYIDQVREDHGENYAKGLYAYAGRSIEPENSRK